MNVNASIVDHRVTGLIDGHPEWFADSADPNRRKSAAFVLLCMSSYLGIAIEESVDLLTEGGNDAGVDGLRIGDVEDDEFLVTLFQGKYKVKDLSGTANFPENSVRQALDTVQVLFDPYRTIELNEKIKPKIAEIHSLVRDGYIPSVRFVLCNNGARWTSGADHWVAASEREYGDKVRIVHYNHDSIVSILQRPRKVDAVLTLSGAAIVEDMNYQRVLVGRAAVQEIGRLFERHGDQLLERNVRRYLGLLSNRVNAAIHDTLCDPGKSDKFYFYNNGITMVCDKFDYNAFQKSDYQVRIRNLQVINGAQTCMTIQRALSGGLADAVAESAYVLIRVYQLAGDDREFVHDITYATNSQNPVSLRDLRSNDELQRRLELGISQLGYTYQRQRAEGSGGSKQVTGATVAEAVLAVWRARPQQARFLRKEHFGKLYDDIFRDLNAAQALLAVAIFRDVESARRHPTMPRTPDFLPYASHHISLLVGRALLHDRHVTVEQVSHRNYGAILAAFERDRARYYREAVDGVEQALRYCYGDRNVSPQQLAATFRRGDLLEILNR